MRRVGGNPRVPGPARASAPRVAGPGSRALRLMGLVTLGGTRLALQMTQLLVEFVADVVQSFQVLLGMLHAVLGLPAPLLVLGNPGGFLEKSTQFLGPRFDHARNHALFDHRVAACTEPGAEEHVGDVLAAAACAVEKVRGDAVAADRALDRDLAESGILPAERAVGVVEDDFDHGLPDRLARIGAIEDDVGHRFTAQVLGRTFTHDPDQGVDDVGLAATVRSDDAGEVAGEGQSGGIDEGFEARDLDSGDAHGRQGYSIAIRAHNATRRSCVLLQLAVIQAKFTSRRDPIAGPARVPWGKVRDFVRPGSRA